MQKIFCLGAPILIFFFLFGCAKKGFKQTHSRCVEIEELKDELKDVDSQVKKERSREDLRTMKLQGLYAKQNRLQTEVKVAQMECQQAYHKHRTEKEKELRSTETN